MQQPAIILTHTQLSHNIGSTARAMLNFGLTELRLVKPLLGDKWYDKNAVSMAAGADAILDGAKVFETLEEATADLHFLISTTDRRRDMIKPVGTPKSGIEKIYDFGLSDIKTGIIFGCEKSGLTNDQIAITDMVVEIPVNKDFSSLNLSQAVLVMAYEWFQKLNTTDKIPTDLHITPDTKPASRNDFDNLIKHLERELEKGGFFTSPEKKPTTLRKIRNLFIRAQSTEQEIKTLHGIINSLSNPYK